MDKCLVDAYSSVEGLLEWKSLNYFCLVFMEIGLLLPNGFLQHLRHIIVALINTFLIVLDAATAIVPECLLLLSGRLLLGKLLSL